MRREIFIHIAFWFSFFVLVSLFKGFLTPSYWPFWVGGVLGLILPDIDHLVYVFFMNPQDLTSQRVNFLLRKKEFRRTISLLYETREERKNLVFHTFLFQAIFLVLTFLIISSSSSIFGIGLVLSFALHLSVDQLIDLVDMKNLANWGNVLPFELDFSKSKIYFIIALLLVFVMGLLM
jgi:hypothetical protein